MYVLHLDQQMLNRLTKSAQTQAKLDEEYFSRNMEGHQVRLKWENTLKNCYQVCWRLTEQRQQEEIQGYLKKN